MPYNQKSKANLQPGCHKAGLKRGGSKGRSRSFLTLKEIDFCSYMAQMGNARSAARYADLNEKTAHHLLKRPLAIEAIKKFTEEYAAKITERDAERREERKELIHREFMYRLPRMKTHRFRGDDTVVKLLKAGFESVGEIQPARILNQIHAQAEANARANIGLKVVIEHIGRPKDQIAAQAVFAGKTLERS